MESKVYRLFRLASIVAVLSLLTFSAHADTASSGSCECSDTPPASDHELIVDNCPGSYRGCTGRACSFAVEEADTSGPAENQCDPAFSGPYCGCYIYYVNQNPDSDEFLVGGFEQGADVAEGDCENGEVTYGNSTYDKFAQKLYEYDAQDDEDVDPEGLGDDQTVVYYSFACTKQTLPPVN